MAPSQLVDVAPLGRASAATVTWSMRGQLHVTVVVKATFSLVPERRMSLIEPDPIATEEQPDPSGRALQSAGDLAPFLGQCGVVVNGHAELPPGFSSPQVVVWLALVQDGQVRVDKRVQLDGSARVGAARAHVRLEGLGPLSQMWPARRRLLGGVDARRLSGPQPDIPEGIDWGYFQAAPPDQRLDVLRGDEWLVLGGMMAQRPKLRTQLPEARGVARLYRRQRAAPRAGEPIALRPDTVIVDVDRRCASILWRGYTPVDKDELASLRVLAGVETPTLQLPWVDPFSGAGASTAPPALHAAPAPAGKHVARMPSAPAAASASAPGRALSGSEDASPLEGTHAFSPEEAARVVAAATTPFGAPRASADAATRAVRTPAATPAPARAATPAPAPVAVHGPPGGDADVLGGTCPISPEEAARVIAAAATPFEARHAPAKAAGSATSAPAAAPASTPAAAPGHAPALSRSSRLALRAPPDSEDNPLGETSSLSPDDVARVFASAATPFEARRAPLDARPWPSMTATPPRAPVDAPAWQTPAPLPLVGVNAPAAPPVEPPISADANALPTGFGAQFLAAMADAGLPA